MHQNRGFQTISIVLSSLSHCYEAMIKTSVEERYRIKGDEEKKKCLHWASDIPMQIIEDQSGIIVSVPHSH